MFIVKVLGLSVFQLEKESRASRRVAGWCGIPMPTSSSWEMFLMMWTRPNSRSSLNVSWIQWIMHGWRTVWGIHHRVYFVTLVYRLEHFVPVRNLTVIFLPLLFQSTVQSLSSGSTVEGSFRILALWFSMTLNPYRRSSATGWGSAEWLHICVVYVMFQLNMLKTSSQS